MITFFIILSLILITGLFVAAEFAIVSVPRISIEKSVTGGNKLASIVRKIIQSPKNQDRYIATAQVGISLASLGLGMYGEHVLAEWIHGLLQDMGNHSWVIPHTVASFVAITVLTYFEIVFGEMIPKSLALQEPERASMFITPLVLLVQFLLYPLVKIVNTLRNIFLHIFGIKREISSGEHYYTSDELELIVKESQEGGLIKDETGKIIRDLFEFGDLTAGEIMVPRVKITGIPLNVTSSELKEIVNNFPLHTRYPVYEENLDHISGLVHIKDILRRLHNKETLQKKDIHKVPYVPETSTIDDVIKSMCKKHTQMVIVMDEHGGTSGLITIEDLYEEVVGDIWEGTESTPEIYKDSKGLLHALGTARLEKVGEEIEILLEHEEVDTVSGLVLALLGCPPRVGDTVNYRNITFNVLAVEGQGVRECTVIKEDIHEESKSTTHD
jgi:CBS domain containing-hemolysin-like protein